MSIYDGTGTVDWAGVGAGAQLPNQAVQNSASLLEAEQEQAFKRQQLQQQSQIENDKIASGRQTAQNQLQFEMYKQQNPSAYEQGQLANVQRGQDIEAQRDANTNQNEQARVGIEGGRLQNETQQTANATQEQQNKNQVFARSQMEQNYLAQAGHSGGLPGTIQALTELGHGAEAATLQKTLAETQAAMWGGKKTAIEAATAEDGYFNGKAARAMQDGMGGYFALMSAGQHDAAGQLLSKTAANVDAFNAAAGHETSYSALNPGMQATAFGFINKDNNDAMMTAVNNPNIRPQLQQNGVAQAFMPVNYSDKAIMDVNTARAIGTPQDQQMTQFRAMNAGMPNSISINTGNGTVSGGQPMAMGTDANGNPVVSQMPNVSPLTDASKNDLQKKMLQQQNLVGMGQEVLNNLNPDAFKYVGKGQNAIANFQDKLPGDLSPEQQKLIESHANTMEPLHRFVDEYSGYIGGQKAVGTEARMAQIEKDITSGNMGPTTAAATIKAFVGGMNNDIDRQGKTLGQMGVQLSANRAPTAMTDDQKMNEITRLSQSDKPEDASRASQLLNEVKGSNYTSSQNDSSKGLHEMDLQAKIDEAKRRGLVQ